MKPVSDPSDDCQGPSCAACGHDRGCGGGGGMWCWRNRFLEPAAAGLSSKKIFQILPCMRDADGGPPEIATPQLVTDLTAERERIDRMISDLVRSRDVLDDVIETAGAEPQANEG